MGNVVNNISLGRFVHYSTLPAANDALIVVPLEQTSIEADAALRDHDTLSALLAGSSNEQTTIGRKTITSVTVTVDDTNERTDVDFADPVWTGTSGNQVGALQICYDPDTTAGDDTTVVPMTKHDFVVTPTGDLTAQLAAAGFGRAAG